LDIEKTKGDSPMTLLLLDTLKNYQIEQAFYEWRLFYYSLIHVFETDNKVAGIKKTG
jgi:hypothetical protein